MISDSSHAWNVVFIVFIGGSFLSFTGAYNAPTAAGALHEVLLCHCHLVGGADKAGKWTNLSNPRTSK